ncbi:MAG: threonine synthase [Pelagibacteraceae bacterium]|nr:threonine synthase [Pelagibacteraceae bacterium]
MRYFSTRDKSLDLSFKDIFFKGLSNDGGLFLPKNIPVLSETDLKKFQDYNFQEMSYEIFNLFTGDTFKKNDLKKIINDAYTTFRNEKIVDIKKIDHISFLQLYHGPTLAFKDIAMQVLGQMYNFLLKDSKKVINLITATSGDTGAAAIDAVQGKKSISIFVLHPHNKISSIQRKLMTTYEASNVFNIAIKGSFDDCQKIVKDMFLDQGFSNQINMSGVNSINWARIVAQIVYYFYIFFKFNPKNKPITISVPTGNFGDIYAGYIAKRMGINIKELIVATNQNNILERCVNTGQYKPLKVVQSISPSMDIQVASNFERILFYLCKEDSKELSKLMSDLVNKGYFDLSNTQLEILRKFFKASSCSESETLSIIKDIYEKYKYIIDPHTATAVKPLLEDEYKKEVNFCFETAHPSKFPIAISKAINQNPELPNEFLKIKGREEKFDILDNDLNLIKKYILEKINN